MTTGKPLMDQFLGGRPIIKTNRLSAHSGISRSSSSSLMTLALPVIMAFIGRKVFSSGGGASSLMNLLGNPKSFLQRVPAGLASVLGIGDTAALPRQAFADAERRVAGATSYAPPAGGSTWWRWAIPLLLGLGLVGLLAYFLMRPQAPAPTVATEQPAVATAPVTAPA